MTLKEFRTAINAVGIPVYHGVADKERDKFISWLETSREYFNADSGIAEITYKISLTLFTKTEYDEETIEKLEDIFIKNSIVFSNTKIDCINDYTVYAYTWQLEIMHSR